MACQGSNTEIGVDSHLHASDNCLPKAFAHPPVTSHVLMALMAVPVAVVFWGLCRSTIASDLSLMDPLDVRG